jgi:type IV secretion system protein VirB11
MSTETVEFLERCIHAELNILISGGTGTGKTTLLNALSSAIPESDRIVTIEDSAELRLNQKHVLRLESRPQNIEGEGEITIRELLRNSLRMRPDRIVVGEVRGPEALDLLKAWGTGHPGGIATIHAGSAHGALTRLEQLIQEVAVTAPRALIAESVNVIVFIAGRGRSRRVEDIVRVVGHDSRGYQLSAELLDAFPPISSTDL